MKGAFAGLSALLVAGQLSAEEPRVPGEPRMMREPGVVVDVPDAVDEGDPIDIEVALSYWLDVERGLIVRGQGESRRELANLSALTSRLVPELRIGIFRDLAGTVRLPIVLSQNRDLASVDDGVAGAVTADDGEVLFDLPMRSPERSGIEHLAFGFLVGVMNQVRDPDWPSWTVGVEAKISLGPSLVPCNDAPAEGQVACANPGDIDRDGVIDDDEPDGGLAQDPGMTRGTAALALHTVVSKRLRYVEPFGILRAELEFPLEDTPLAPTRDADSSLLPVRAGAELGLGIIPWENRARWSRVWIDARVVGGLVTRGRDFSPLFDAIGSSSAASLRSPVIVSGARAYETGVTVVDTHGVLGASGSFIWRASQLIRLGLLASFEHQFEHAIADDQPCADGGKDCNPQSNPEYRASLDGPSGRLFVADSFLVRIGATGAVLF